MSELSVSIPEMVLRTCGATCYAFAMQEEELVSAGHIAENLFVFGRHGEGSIGFVSSV